MSRHPRPRSSERGAVLAMLPMFLVIGALLLLGATRLGMATVVQARADAAADAAALAAAEELALGRGSTAAYRAAFTAAHVNGARLSTCDCEGAHADVEVLVPPPLALRMLGLVRGHARAEVERGVLAGDG